MKVINKELVFTQTEEAWFELNSYSRQSFNLYCKLLSSDNPAYDFLKREDLTVSQIREGLNKAIANGQNTSNAD